MSFMTNRYEDFESVKDGLHADLMEFYEQRPQEYANVGSIFGSISCPNLSDIDEYEDQFRGSWKLGSMTTIFDCSCVSFLRLSRQKWFSSRFAPFFETNQPQKGNFKLDFS